MTSKEEKEAALCVVRRIEELTPLLTTLLVNVEGLTPAALAAYDQADQRLRDIALDAYTVSSLVTILLGVVVQTSPEEPDLDALISRTISQAAGAGVKAILDSLRRPV